MDCTIFDQIFDDSRATNQQNSSKGVVITDHKTVLPDPAAVELLVRVKDK